MLKELQRQSRKKSEVKTGRRIRFEEEYLKNRNALEAAKAAGYSKAYALARSYEFAREVNVTLARVARAKGYTEHKLIDKYGGFLDSKSEKIQLEATRDLCEIIEPRQSSTTLGAAMGHGKDGRPTLQIVLQHTMPRPDRSKQAVKTLTVPLDIPTNGSSYDDD